MTDGCDGTAQEQPEADFVRHPAVSDDFRWGCGKRSLSDRPTGGGGPCGGLLGQGFKSSQGASWGCRAVAQRRFHCAAMGIVRLLRKSGKVGRIQGLG